MVGESLSPDIEGHGVEDKTEDLEKEDIEKEDIEGEEKIELE